MKTADFPNTPHSAISFSTLKCAGVLFRLAGSTAPPPKTDPHICNKPYAEVEDLQQDLSYLVATYQHHTRCSPAYCLRTQDGQQKRRFGYPKPLQPETTLLVENGELELLTARNGVSSTALTLCSCLHSVPT